MQPTTKIPAPELAAAEQHCPDCDAPLNTDQRYCLNCGQRRAEMRLPFMDMVEADAQAAQTAGRVSPGAILASAPPTERSPLVVLTSLIALLLALGIGVLIGRGSGEPERVAKAPVVNVSGAGAGTSAPVAITSDWPAGTNGFTVLLKTLPAAATAAEVAAAKQDATAKGATDAGALRGDEYPTVGEQGIVIYSGVFTTRKEARAALKGLTASFPDAKVVEVGDSTDAGSAGGGGETVKKDPEAKPIPKGGENLSPQEYQKRSRRLPDKVQSEGRPPPKDNAAPGGGSKATEIG